MTETISSLPPARGSHPARSFPGRSDAASNAGAEATPTASMMPVFQRTRLQRATVFAGGLLAAALFASSLTQPWWRFSLYAPQYPRGLTLLLSLSGMTGDVREIDMLNHYIGMGHLSEAASFERAHAVHGVVLLCVALLGLAVLSGRRARWSMVLAGALFPLGFLADSMYWLHRFGHELDPRAPLHIPPFTPQLFGNGAIGQFMTYAVPQQGFVLALAGVLVLLAIALAGERGRKPLPTATGCCGGVVDANSMGHSDRSLEGGPSAS